DPLTLVVRVFNTLTVLDELVGDGTGHGDGSGQNDASALVQGKDGILDRDETLFHLVEGVVGLIGLDVVKEDGVWTGLTDLHTKGLGVNTLGHEYEAVGTPTHVLGVTLDGSALTST